MARRGPEEGIQEGGEEISQDVFFFRSGDSLLLAGFLLPIPGVSFSSYPRKPSANQAVNHGFCQLLCAPPVLLVDSESIRAFLYRASRR